VAVGYALRHVLRIVVVVALAVLAGSAALAALVCAGDCDRDDQVTVEELVTSVDIALDARPVGECVAVDSNGDGRVTVDELLAAVANALRRQCYAATRSPQSASVELAQEIADAQLARQAPQGLGWDWGEAVLMHGLFELYRVTGEVRYRAYVADWLDHHIATGYEIISSDTCAPGLAAVALYGDSGEARYRDTIDAALRYLYEEAPRTPEGGISHLGTILGLPPALWVDSLFMFGMVLARWGELGEDARALQEYAAQFAVFAELLQDDAGYFRHSHAWFFPHDEDVFWARGNGWAAVSAYEYLRVRRRRHESDPLVEAAAQRLIGAVFASQDPASGLWWTVADHPGETYLETSASALFAYAMARGVRYGYVDRSVLPAVDGAMRGLLARIARNPLGRPVVTGISGPTTVTTLGGYAIIPVHDDLSYGVGAVILALVETSGLAAEDMWSQEPSREVGIAEATQR
jgi:unsaturated rhamnogalacturonyl hydrolase